MLDGHEYESIRRSVATEFLRLTVCVGGPLAVLSIFIRQITVGQHGLALPVLLLIGAACALYMQRDRLSEHVLSIGTATIWLTVFWMFFVWRGVLSTGPYFLAPALIAAMALLPHRFTRWGVFIVTAPVYAILLLSIFGIYDPLSTTRVPFESPKVFWFTTMIAMTVAAIMFQRILTLIDGRLRSQQQTAQLSIYKSMSAVASLRDVETGGHLDRCARYAELLAASDPTGPYGPSGAGDLAKLALAVPLHDIGKVGVRDQVLLKPGKLDDNEFAEMQKHTELGCDLIRRFRTANDLADDAVLTLAEQIALSHHENWDGSGYPQGLQREEIPYEARVMALADVYDALRSPRPYKTARTHEETAQIMEEMAPRKFDPHLYRLFRAHMPDFSAIYDGTGDVGPTAPKRCAA